MTDDPPLTEREQRLMAYIDEELDSEERAAFEETMAADPDLAAEATRHRNIMDLSHSMALAEPSDHETRRFWAGFYNRTEWRLGWVLLSAGLVVLAIEGSYLLLTSDALTWLQKGAAATSIIGGLLLLLNTVRLKIRTSQFDRYRGVIR